MTSRNRYAVPKRRYVTTKLRLATSNNSEGTCFPLSQVHKRWRSVNIRVNLFFINILQCQPGEHKITYQNWRSWDRASLEQRCEQPTRCNNFCFFLIFLFIYLNLRYMFRATISPILRSTYLTVYTAFGTIHWYCCRAVTRLRWDSISTLSPAGSNIGVLYQKWYLRCCKDYV